ncbi:MAG: AzlC family ABC transporter permease [Steroidobacteraceae bacterium]
MSAVTFTRAGFRAGLLGVLPLTVGLVPFGVVVGVTAQAHGLSLLEALLMSGLVFAGSAQILCLSAWTIPAAALAAGITSLVMNLRFMLMGPLLAPWLDQLHGARRWGSLFFVVDQNWAVALREINGGARDAAWFLGSGVNLWCCWVATTALGYLLGRIVAPEAGHPLFFAAAAVFITLLVPMWRGKRDLAPWIVAAGVAIAVSRALPHTSWHIVAGALAGGTVGAFGDRAKASNESES